MCERKMIMAGYMAHLRKTRNAYAIYIGNTEGKRLFGELLVVMDER
jgi:hypothetical protein